MNIPKQNWGTFETAAQRKTGKTHEESMADIDKFVAEGVAKGTVDAVAGPHKLTGELGAMLQRNGIKGVEVNSYAFGAAGSGSKGGGGKVVTTTEVTETVTHQEGDRKEGLVGFGQENKFKPTGTSTADQFLKQYQDAEAAKFKPGYANKNPNGVR